ncbi:DUF1573 domain-containing protein [Aurantibacillus circumpalustris]|uniref:DUF1573 domain-containing protein n=1 Tax=Aurantibacillus circumpalustris TaxID=3036359 RepID=UPI00295AE1BA|nr:DUF1573 domain-containing protein [Aurantibacillus circumpalustris]
MKTTLKLSTIVIASALLSFSPSLVISHSLNSEKILEIKRNIKWKNTEINLGDIVQNKPVTLEFEFTNVGDNPVLITNVQASCGCTSTNYIKTPILPGESTKISAVFNAAAKGVFKKQITVITNAEDGPRTLSFTGTVM